MNKPLYSRRRLKKLGIKIINRGKSVEIKFNDPNRINMSKVQYFLESKRSITLSVDIVCSAGSMVMVDNNY